MRMAKLLASKPEMVTGKAFSVIRKVKSLMGIAKQRAPKPEIVAGKAFSADRKVISLR